LKTYKHIFFDLDRTLWDLERNSDEAIIELYEKHGLGNLGIKPFEHFNEVYRKVNERMWAYYLKGQINKETLRFGRFHKTFLAYGVDDPHLAKRFAEDYTHLAPQKPHVFPGTHDVLNYLKGKYKLHIITNGFEDVQYIKMTHSNLHPYFEHIVTSDRAGVQKPTRGIFEYTVSLAKAVKEECIMIGDSYEVDIIGARNAGIDQVYFNNMGDKKGKACTYEISELKELMKFL
jgi:putative hydrolase of the HAD superfamily